MAPRRGCRRHAAGHVLPGQGPGRLEDETIVRTDAERVPHDLRSVILRGRPAVGGARRPGTTNELYTVVARIPRPASSSRLRSLIVTWVQRGSSGGGGWSANRGRCQGRSW